MTEFEKRFTPDTDDELNCLYEYLWDNGLDRQDFFKEYFPTAWAIENPEYFEREMKDRLHCLDDRHIRALEEFVSFFKRRILLENV